MLISAVTEAIDGGEMTAGSTDAPAGVHLVGSIPLGDAETVLATVGRELGPYVRRIPDFIEVSAVCTRPSHLGRGYARSLIMHLVGEIISRSCTPFLHVRSDNKRAIEVYQQLGFTTRHEMRITFIKKKV